MISIKWLIINYDLKTSCQVAVGLCEISISQMNLLPTIKLIEFVIS